jgi:hypothetical protein
MTVKLWLWLLDKWEVILGIAVALVGAMYFRKGGKDSVILESNKRTVNAVKERTHVENELRSLPDDDYERVRDEWVRKR